MKIDKLIAVVPHQDDEILLAEKTIRRKGLSDVLSRFDKIIRKIDWRIVYESLYSKRIS